MFVDNKETMLSYDNNVFQ